MLWNLAVKIYGFHEIPVQMILLDCGVIQYENETRSARVVNKTRNHTRSKQLEAELKRLTARHCPLSVTHITFV